MEQLRATVFDEEKYKKLAVLSNLYSPVLQQEYEKWQEISQKTLSPDVVEQLERLAKMEQALTANSENIAKALQTLQPFLKNSNEISSSCLGNGSTSAKAQEQTIEQQGKETGESVHP